MPRWDGVVEPVGEIVALKRQDYRDLAQELLEKVYRYVLPIMRNHRYRVHRLVEFLPKNPNLLGLNVNHGQRISLRLRYQHNPREFLPFESVLGTMLHELCHNTFGPHDSKFFKLLDELTKELEDLMARGFRGDPFLGAGRTLNAVPGGPLVKRGSAAAPAPVAPAAKTPYGTRKLGRGRRLGGLGRRTAAARGASPRDLALQAAERRRQAEESCKTARKLEELSSDERGEVVDLTQDPGSDDGPVQEVAEVIYILDDD